MKKILLISVGAHFGGIEKLELEYVKNLKNDFQIDIMSLNECTFKDYEKEIIDSNCKLLNLGIKKFSRINELVYDYKLYKFLKNNKYDIVHINSGIFFYSFRVALICKLVKIKRVISHSHSAYPTSKIKRIIIKLLKPVYEKMIDVKIACSVDAGKSLFFKKDDIIILKNGINVNSFKYSEEIRNNYRNNYKINDKRVYCSIGRFVKQKNYEYLIDIFYEVQKLDSNSILVLVGEGILKSKIEAKVKSLNIEDKVMFLGFRNDISGILCMSDVFILSSLTEGLGIVAIEAQTNGLITYCSINVPIEAKISPYFRYFKLNENAKNIASEILKDNIDETTRNVAYKYSYDSGYDIKDVSKRLKEIYNNLLEEK